MPLRQGSIHQLQPKMHFMHKNLHRNSKNTLHRFEFSSYDGTEAFLGIRCSFISQAPPFSFQHFERALCRRLICKVAPCSNKQCSSHQTCCYFKRTQILASERGLISLNLTRVRRLFIVRTQGRSNEYFHEASHCVKNLTLFAALESSK